MSCARDRFQYAEPACDASARGHHQPARRTAVPSLRQWTGGKQSAVPGLVCGAKYRHHSHPARKAHAERARPKFSRPIARRMSERELVLESLGCKAQNCKLAIG